MGNQLATKRDLESTSLQVFQQSVVPGHPAGSVATRAVASRLRRLAPVDPGDKSS